MWKLAAILYPIVATVAAGVAVLVGLVVPDLGLADMTGLAQLGLGGYVIGAPLSVIVGYALSRQRSSFAAT